MDDAHRVDEAGWLASAIRRQLAEATLTGSRHWTCGQRVRAALLPVLAWVTAPANAEWRPLELPMALVTEQSASSPSPEWQVEVSARPCHLAGVAVRLGEAERREWLAPTHDADAPQSQGTASAEFSGQQWHLSREEAERAVLVLRYDCTWIALATRWPTGATAVRVHADARFSVAGRPAIVAVEWWWPVP
jgi:hypothetical protein